MSKFPEHFIDPKRKNEKWVKDYMKAAWADFRGVYPSTFYNGREKYHETKLYMIGKQPIEKYKKVLDPQKTASGDTSWLNINWSILPIVSKYRRIALGNLNKIDYNITAQAVDSVSQDDREKYYGELAAKILLKQEFEAQGLDSSMIDLEGKSPQSIEELEMHMKYSYKHQMAMEFEMAIDLVLKSNDFETKRKEVIRDLFDYGIAGYKEYFDSDGEIKIRRVDPANMIVGYSKLDNFEDVQYMGEIIDVSVSDLKQMAGDQLSEKDYEDILKRSQETRRYQTRRGTGADNDDWESDKIQVLDLEFFSVNDIVTEHRINSKGNKVVGRASYKPRKKSKSDFKRTSYKVVYGGKWVMGTDIFFDCGLKTNMKRSKSNYADTSMSYHMYANDLYTGTATSLGYQMIPIADEIQKAFYKLQNVVIRARPKGLALDISSLESVALGRGGALEPIEIIDFYNQTGNLPWRSIDPEGNPGNIPIMELNNGLGQEAEQWFAIISNNIQLLRDILGFNEITDGSTPDPRTLKGVANMAAQSTNNSLSFIRDGERSLMERLAYGLSLRIQDAAKMGTLSGYSKAIGTDSIEFFKVDPDVTTRDIGIFLEDMPDDQQREQLDIAINEAIKSNQLTVSDKIIIQSIDNLKMAEEMLAYRSNKHMEKMQEQAMQQQQQNGQIQQESARVAEEERRNTLNVETQSKIAIAEAEHKFKMEQIQLTKNLEKEIAQIGAQGKVVQNQITAESNEVVAEIKNQKSAGAAKEPKD